MMMTGKKTSVDDGDPCWKRGLGGRIISGKARCGLEPPRFDLVRPVTRKTWRNQYFVDLKSVIKCFVVDLLYII